MAKENHPSFAFYLPDALKCGKCSISKTLHFLTGFIHSLFSAVFINLFFKAIHAVPAPFTAWSREMLFIALAQGMQDPELRA